VVRAADVVDAKVQRQPAKEALRGDRAAFDGLVLRREIELEPIGAGSHRPVEKVADSAVGVGQRLGHADRSVVLGKLVEDDVDARRRSTQLGVQDVGRNRGSRNFRPAGHAILRAMADLQIRVGDLHFSARWEGGAPRTIAAVRAMLPIERQLIHCRWSGESTWIPFGDFRPGLDYENHTSHPAPGQITIYPGGISECEIFFPYGACSCSSKVGQLAGNHFATVVPDDGWADRLREVGRRCLWEGAQPVSIVEDR
jgi:hypothetical protein